VEKLSFIDVLNHIVVACVLYFVLMSMSFHNYVAHFVVYSKCCIKEYFFFSVILTTPY